MDNPGACRTVITSNTYRVVQPWGPNKATQATIISEHPTAADAFEAIDRIAAQIARCGARAEDLEMLVVDTNGQIVRRPGVQ